MIFNNNTSSTGAVKESKYELGLSGALMHVYENECNFNAIVKSVGLSELKYYQETGKDLFLNEAGAFSSFIAKVKEFFKKVLEKIKAIFHKFMAVINSFVMKDKEFVKKYGNEIRRKDITDLKFNGYRNLTDPKKLGEAKFNPEAFVALKDTISVKEPGTTTYDDLEKKKNEQRALILDDAGKEYTRTEMLEELKERCYGDKEEFTVTSDIRDIAIRMIEKSNDFTKSLKEDYNKFDKSLKEVISNLEKLEKEYNGKDVTSNLTDEKDKKDARDINSKHVTFLNQRINLAKELADDSTAVFGFFSGFLKDANRQSRAICVKIIGYKKQESARLESANDIFAGVQLV